MDASMNEASNFCFITSSRSSAALVTPSTRHIDKERVGKSSKCISVTAASAPASLITASLSAIARFVRGRSSCNFVPMVSCPAAVLQAGAGEIVPPHCRRAREP